MDSFINNPMVTVTPAKTLAPLPRHVAVIMDGNGRWAENRGLSRNAGHRAGVDNARKIVRHSSEIGIRYLTLYAFSVENWNRPRTEINALMTLLERFLLEEAKELHDRRIRLRVIGRIRELPSRIAKLTSRIIDETAHYNEWNLTLALNYGSRTETLDAVKAYARAVQEGAEDPAQLDWEQFSRYLYTGLDLPDPDLILRTSGEWRVSNFLLLQSAYAEYYFSQKCWPEFGPEDFTHAIENYRARERRFGKTSAQVRETSSRAVLSHP